MELKDLKNSSKSIEDRASEYCKELGIAEDARSIARGLRKGDTFKLTAMNKVEMQANGNSNFQPITFSTNIGATVGAKHFSDIDFDSEAAPTLGATPKENACFFIYCLENEIEFRCVAIKSLEERELPDGTKYTPKEFKLEIV